MQQFSQTIDAPNLNRNLYDVVQQEVELGGAALKRGDAEIAVTFFQSALKKLSPEQPFYDHLVHNLLLACKLLIEQCFTAGQKGAALRHLRFVLRLEIRGEMADDSMFLKKFAGEFQGLAVVLSQYGHPSESLACCRKAISIYRLAGSHINLTNALVASGESRALGFHGRDRARAAGSAHFYRLHTKERFDVSQKHARKSERLSRRVHGYVARAV